MQDTHPFSAPALLQWYIDSGVDEAIGDLPRNWLAAPPPPPAPMTALAPLTPRVAPAMAAPQPPSEAIAAARALADACITRAELEAAVRGFTGCAIKRTATNTVFSDGNPEARVMVIGEAPGAQEDQQGIPFCGPSGMLLDKMLQAIGLDRTKVYITNTVFWRPPGNRTPSIEELAICEPFVEKHIALINPALIIMAGGVATTAILKREQSVSRLRGKMYEYTNRYLESPVGATILFHPAYLMRSPAQKRLAWHDLLLAKEFLTTKGLM